MKIVLLDEAQRCFEAEDEWWREHRDAKHLFLEEFARARADLLDARNGTTLPSTPRQADSASADT